MADNRGSDDGAAEEKSSKKRKAVSSKLPLGTVVSIGACIF